LTRVLQLIDDRVSDTEIANQKKSDLLTPFLTALEPVAIYLVRLHYLLSYTVEQEPKYLLRLNPHCHRRCRS
jgi:hypothetical protein